MKQATPFSLDQVAGKATITIEQTAQVLGLGRTAAYDAARRGDCRPAGSDAVSSCPYRRFSSG